MNHSKIYAIHSTRLARDKALSDKGTWDPSKSWSTYTILAFDRNGYQNSNPTIFAYKVLIFLSIAEWFISATFSL
ncbi:hypothetical protein Q3G72_000392 [Acer saccharum]|nr:hypothetical protein Q3G72_000392 [Acer saccharum]